MNINNWLILSGCTSKGGGCLSCPSLLEYKANGWDYSIKMHPERLAEPLLVEEPTCFIVALGSDLFHDDVPWEFIDKVFQVMNKCPEHKFEIATKRVERLACVASSLKWTDNIMIGTAVESDEHLWRMGYLQQVPTENRFVSFAPLLGDVGSLDLTGIKMAGGTGEDYGLRRPFDPAWLENIKRQCDDQKVQWINSFSIYESEAA